MKLWMHGVRFAWRNLWRNSRRTAISLAAVTASTAVLILTNSLIAGLLEQLVHRVTALGVGEAQVHASGRTADSSLHRTISAPDRIVAAGAAKGIAAAERGLGFGLLAQGTRSLGGQIWGVDPAAEARVGELPTHLAAGRFLGAKAGREIVLGKRLALSLAATPGSELVAVVQAADNSTGTELFRVVGVLDSTSEAIDRGVALLHRDDFAALFGLNGVHEIVLSSRGQMSPEAVSLAVSDAAQGAEVRTWRKLLPAVGTVVDLWNGVTALMSAIFFLAAGLGVLNTMLMATSERIPEFGLVAALGATPGRILRSMALEAGLLGVLGTALGTLLGLCVGYYAEVRGFDLSGVVGQVSVSGVRIQALWHARLSVGAVVPPVVTMWVICCVAALIPAWKAARLDPVQALTHV